VERARRAGARKQRPLWASTSTKNRPTRHALRRRAHRPDTVNTIPTPPSRRSTTTAPSPARSTTASTRPGRCRRLAEVGVDLADVTRVLEDEGVAAFSKSFDELIDVCSQVGRLRA
jgi:transaldolase